MVPQRSVAAKEAAQGWRRNRRRAKLLRLLRVDEIVEAVEARNIIGDLLAKRQSRNTGAFRLRGNDFRKERAQLGGSQAAGEHLLVAIVIDEEDRDAEVSTGCDADPH